MHTAIHDLHTHILPGLDDGGEVYVRGDVLQTGQVEGVGVRTVTVMAHQRAFAALRVVELVARKAIIDEQQRAPAEKRGPGRRPVLDGQADFAQIAGGQGVLGRQFARTLGQPAKSLLDEILELMAERRIDE